MIHDFCSNSWIFDNFTIRGTQTNIFKTYRFLTKSNLTCTIYDYFQNELNCSIISLAHINFEHFKFYKLTVTVEKKIIDHLVYDTITFIVAVDPYYWSKHQNIIIKYSNFSWETSLDGKRSRNWGWYSAARKSGKFNFGRLKCNSNSGNGRTNSCWSRAKFCNNNNWKWHFYSCRLSSTLH